MKHFISFLCALFLIFSPIAYADKDKAETALAEVLFDSDMENVQYVVDNHGGVDIIFGVTVADDEFDKVVTESGW